MWKNTKTSEMISDEEMNRIAQQFSCYVSNMGRMITCEKQTWSYVGDDPDVLYE